VIPPFPHAGPKQIASGQILSLRASAARINYSGLHANNNNYTSRSRIQHSSHCSRFAMNNDTKVLGAIKVWEHLRCGQDSLLLSVGAPEISSPQALANSKISLFDLSTIRIFARLEYKSVQKIDL